MGLTVGELKSVPGIDPLRLYKEVYGRGEEELFPEEKRLLAEMERLYSGDRKLFPLRADESALIVVDMQNSFVAQGAPLWIPEALRQLPRVRGLIDACRELKVPVIYTATIIEDDCKNIFYELFPALRESTALSEGSEGADIHPDIYPQRGERVIKTKHAYSAFSDTDLDYILRDLGVRTVIICGTMTNVCCEATARDAFSLHYWVVFGSDVNSTDDGLAHLATLRTMRRNYGRVMTSDEIIHELRSGR